MYFRCKSCIDTLELLLNGSERFVVHCLFDIALKKKFIGVKLEAKIFLSFSWLRVNKEVHVKCDTHGFIKRKPVRWWIHMCQYYRFPIQFKSYIYLTFVFYFIINWITLIKNPEATLRTDCTYEIFCYRVLIST